MNSLLNLVHHVLKENVETAHRLCITCHSWSMSSCGFLLRRQSTSSVSLLPLQPTSFPSSVALLRASAGLTVAQGQLGTPLWRMALVKVSRLSGDNRWNPTEAAPALSPKMVTFVIDKKTKQIEGSWFKLAHTAFVALKQKLNKNVINKPVWGFHQRNECFLVPSAAPFFGPTDPHSQEPPRIHAEQETQRHQSGNSWKSQWRSQCELGNGHHTHPEKKNHCRTLEMLKKKKKNQIIVNALSRVVTNIETWAEVWHYLCWDFINLVKQLEQSQTKQD